MKFTVIVREGRGSAKREQSSKKSQATYRGTFYIKRILIPLDCFVLNDVSTSDGFSLILSCISVGHTLDDDALTVDKSLKLDKGAAICPPKELTLFWLFSLNGQI